MGELAADAGALDPRGPAAESIADLWWLMLGLGVAVFVLVAVLLVVGLFRRQPPTDEIGDTAPGSFNRWLIGGGVVLPVVVVAIVFFATVETMRDTPTEAEAGDGDRVVIEITGHQWWWEVRYPDEGIVTANEITIPTGEPVTFELTSADVIHSFWVPSLGGKLDLLPEDTNTLVLQADEPGRYASDCAEFCGLQHALMDIVVIAEPPDRFADWVAERSEPAAAPTSAAAQRGQDLFVEHCASCHTVRGGPEPEDDSAEDDGPDLTHLAGRSELAGGAVDNTAENLATLIADPHSIKEGISMPATELDDGEMDDLLAYLGGLR